MSDVMRWLTREGLSYDVSTFRWVCTDSSGKVLGFIDGHMPPQTILEWYMNIGRTNGYVPSEETR